MTSIRQAKYMTQTTLLSALMSLASAQVLANNLPEQPPPWAPRADVTVPAQPLPAKPGASNAARRSNPVTTTVSAGESSIAEWYRQRRMKVDDSAQVLERLHARVAENDLNAKYELGLFYQKHPELNPGLAEAEYWLEQAAEAEHAKAQYVLALLLRSGAVAVDQDLSLAWQKQSAANGYKEAQYGLGLLYANGQYVNADTGQAQYWFQQAAAQGHAMAKLALANQPAPAPATRPVAPLPAASRPQASPVELEGWVEEAVAQAPVEDQVSEAELGAMTIEQVQAAAQQGNKYAQLMLGALYEDGSKGIAKNLQQAAFWYTKSAEQGYAKAQHNLALLYEDGLGVGQDYASAVYWYQQAAEAGFSEAQNNLAVLYILGKGVQKNADFAEQLLRVAVAQDNENAKRNLSMLTQQKASKN